MINISINHIEFGKGDIGIHMGDTSDVAFLLFRNLKKPASIGRLVGDESMKVTELLDTDVLMSFSNVESINALMKCLRIIRRERLKYSTSRHYSTPNALKTASSGDE